MKSPTDDILTVHFAKEDQPTPSACSPALNHCGIERETVSVLVLCLPPNPIVLVLNTNPNHHPLDNPVYVCRVHYVSSAVPKKTNNSPVIVSCSKKAGNKVSIIPCAL